MFAVLAALFYPWCNKRALRFVNNPVKTDRSVGLEMLRSEKSSVKGKEPNFEL